jgi:SAM-dependent methyltransferase
MSLLARLKAIKDRQAFHPGFLGLVMNPDYITRRGLYLAVRRLAPGLGGRLLDFGCGSKPYAELFTQASSYTGCDIAVSGHDHATSRVDVFFDGRTLPFDDAHFDGVVSFEVFEHVFNLPEMLGEIHRVLKPGGQLLLTIPFAYEEHEAPYDFARYTRYGIAALLRNAGFEVTHSERTGGYLLAVHQMAVIYVVRLLPKNKLLFNAVQALLLFPATAFVLLLDKLLPRKEEFYCNQVVVARRGGATS